MVQSITTPSFKIKEAQTFIQDEIKNLNDTERKLVTKGNTLMGKVKYASLSKIFSHIAAGEKIPKHNYTFRVDGEKISSLINTIQDALQIKPGLIRDITIGSHKFTNLPVYKTESKSQINVYDNYKFLTPKEYQLGRTTFLDVTKLLTKRGEAKAGLSTYYTSFRHSGKEFLDLILRLTMFEIEIDNDLQEFISNVKKIGWTSTISLHGDMRNCIFHVIQKMQFIVIIMLLIQKKRFTIPMYVRKTTTL